MICKIVIRYDIFTFFLSGYPVFEYMSSTCRICYEYFVKTHIKTGGCGYTLVVQYMLYCRQSNRLC